MSDPLRDTGVDFLSVVVGRGEVEGLNLDPALSVLLPLLADRETAIKFQGRVDLSIEGYNEDSRKLYEIPEVCRFFSVLDKVFPFWFYFLTREKDTLAILTLTLCHDMKNQKGAAAVDPVDLEGFFIVHYLALNRLCESLQLGEEVVEAITQEIDKYFRRRSNRIE